MNPIDFLLRKLGLRRRGKIVRFDATLMTSLRELSLQQNRPLEEVTRDILALGLEQHTVRLQTFQTWETLTPRERDVAALACLGYTNPQIAERLTISSETVKVHLRRIFDKFNVRGRKQLAQILKAWDFSAWLDQP